METLESVVHEFTVLYSNRIHQKDKKWSDGTLKYYEFNGKIEILNEDGNMISTDFVQSKNHKQVLSTKLAVSNQFKLTNNKLVIEVTDKRSTYTRDITNSFKKKTSVCLSEIKYESPTIIKKEYGAPLTPTNGDLLNRQTHRRPVGLRKVPKGTSPRTSAIKKEINSSGPLDKPHSFHPPIKVKSEFANEVSMNLASVYAHYSSTTKQKNSKAAYKVDCQKISTNRPKALSPAEPKIAKPTNRLRYLPRILSGSSNHFMYLHKSDKKSGNTYEPDTNHFPTSDPLSTHDTSIRVGTSISTQENERESVVKPEPESFESKKNLDQADIIYDLSDFEEDEKFLKMLQEIREERGSEGSKFNNSSQGSELFVQDNVQNLKAPSTPIRLTIDAQDVPTSAVQKEHNESHDFDLSSSSEFEDIDSTQLSIAH